MCGYTFNIRNPCAILFSFSFLIGCLFYHNLFPLYYSNLKIIGISYFCLYIYCLILLYFCEVFSIFSFNLYNLLVSLLIFFFFFFYIFCLFLFKKLTIEYWKYIYFCKIFQISSNIFMFLYVCFLFLFFFL